MTHTPADGKREQASELALAVGREIRRIRQEKGMTSAPAARSAVTMAAPMPREAPVTTAVLPARFTMSCKT